MRLTTGRVRSVNFSRRKGSNLKFLLIEDNLGNEIRVGLEIFIVLLEIRYVLYWTVCSLRERHSADRCIDI